jgi:hypothetical protein
MVNYSKTQELFNKEPKKSPDLKYRDTFPAGFFGEEMAEERWLSQVKTNRGEYTQELADRFKKLIVDAFDIGQNYSNDSTNQ